MPATAEMNEDDWMQLATAASISAARDVVSGDGINSRAMIGSLSEIEWGWIAAAVIFGWIKTKAQQAVAEGSSVENAIRYTGRDPEPWEIGAVGTILPSLGSIEGLDWSKPIGEWSKDQITSFAWRIYKLTDAALAARDEGATDKIVRFCRENMERQNSAANGGPLIDHNELNDEIPF